MSLLNKIRLFVPGYEKSPRSIGSRVLVCFWFMFVTITIITFTGSLINHLFWASRTQGQTSLLEPFRNIEGMLMSGDYEYGCVEGGSTYTYLTTKGRGDEFDVIRNHLTSAEGKKNIVVSNEAGVDRVRKGNYAFIMESASARYMASRKPCDLVVTGDKFAPRSYGMAVSHSMDRDLLEALHKITLEMHEDGDIEALEKKWYIDRSECWNVTKKEDEMARSGQNLNKPIPVSVAMFCGPMVMLLVGLVLSIVVTSAEFMFHKYKG